jgi:hypothetical protein
MRPGRQAGEYKITDATSLAEAAREYEVGSGPALAPAVAERMIGQFHGRGPLAGLRLAPSARQRLWADAGTQLGGIDVEIAGRRGGAGMGQREGQKTIACYMMASGVDVVLGQPFRIEGSENVRAFLEQEARERFGGGMSVCERPVQASPDAVAGRR